MAWISMVDESEAEGELREIYEKYSDGRTGTMSHIIKIHSFDSPTMTDHLQIYRRLMRRSADSEERNIIALWEKGFSEKAILQVNLITAYFNFVNRVADGLGVQLEDYWEK